MKKKKITFADVAAILLLQKKQSLSKPAFVLMECTLRIHLIPYFGKIPVSELNQNKINAYLSFKIGKRKLADHIKFIKMIVNYSFNEGILVRTFKIRNPDPEASPGKLVTKMQFRILFRAAPNDEIKLMFLMGYILGMRPCEYCRCHKAFIDLKSAIIKLPPWFLKTRRMGDREIPIPRLTVKNKKELSSFARRHLKIMWRLLNKKMSQDGIHLFPSSYNPGQSIRDIKSQWRRLIPGTGLKIRLYDLRHSCVTNMVRSNIHPLKIRAICGVSPQVMRRYSHIPIEELRDCATQAFDKAA